MQLTNEFRVPIPVEQAWGVLTDLERVALCMPGAELREIEGSEYRGVVKVRVGPVTAEYEGKAHFMERDGSGHRAVLRAEGRETKGQGNANATITANLEADGDDATRVSVVTDLAVSGKAAQFGRGVLADVSEKLIDQFVACLETTILGGDPSNAEPEAAADAEPEAAVDAEPEAAVDAEPEAAADAEPEAAADAEPEADVEPEAAADAELEPSHEQSALETPSGPQTALDPGTASPAEHNGVSQAPSPISSNGNTNGSTGGTARKIPVRITEPVDLSQVERPPVAKRLIPALIATVVALGGAFLLRRWRS